MKLSQNTEWTTKIRPSNPLAYHKRAETHSNALHSNLGVISFTQCELYEMVCFPY